MHLHRLFHLVCEFDPGGGKVGAHDACQYEENSIDMVPVEKHSFETFFGGLQGTDGLHKNPWGVSSLNNP